MQTTQSKTILMPTNGMSNSPKTFDWYALLLALAVSISSGSFIFAFKMNAAVAVMQDQRAREELDRTEIKQTMNQMQLDIRDLRDRAIRAERLQKTN